MGKGSAIFSNGRGEDGVPARLRFLDRGLEIRDQRDGLMLALWTYGELRRAPAARQFACRSDPEARLTVEDSRLLVRLEQALRPAPPTAGPAAAPAGRPRRRRRVLAAVLVVLAMAGLGVGRVLPPDEGLPAAWRAAWGDLLVFRLVPALGGRCTGAEGQAALDRLAARLTQGAPLDPRFTVVVADNPAVAAYALPGNRTIVLKGVLIEAQSADEVAAVLAHQLAHLRLGQVTDSSLRRSYTAAAEAEADALAVDLLKKADISVQSMGSFFRRMAARQAIDAASAAFLADHPAAAHRLPEPVVQPFSRPALGEADWLALRAICG